MIFCEQCPCTEKEYQLEFCFENVLVAQRIEWKPPELQVAGSNPAGDDVVWIFVKVLKVIDFSNYSAFS